MKLYSLLVVIISYSLNLKFTESWSFNPICLTTECCNSDYIPANVEGNYCNVTKLFFVFYLKIHICLSPFNIVALNNNLRMYVYGQPLVEIVVLAIQSHWNPNYKPKKALTLSFHGWAGSGKNYVSNFVAENLFKYGTKSKFVHYFVGRIHFPLEKHVEKYKVGNKFLIKDIYFMKLYQLICNNSGFDLTQMIQVSS